MGERKPAESLGRWSSWMAAGLTILAAGLLVGCAGPAAQAGAPSSPQAAEVVISSGALEFDTQTLTAPADTDFTLRYVNNSPMPHNVAVYRDRSAAESLFVGEIIEQGSVRYEVPALPAGQYYFRCDLHPDMDGELVAR